MTTNNLPAVPKWDHIKRRYICTCGSELTYKSYINEGTKTTHHLYECVEGHHWGHSLQRGLWIENFTVVTG